MRRVRLRWRLCRGKAFPWRREPERGAPSAQRPPVPHVQGAGAPQVRPLQEEVGEAVQSHAGGQGGDESVQPAQKYAEGPGQGQQDDEPYDGVEAGSTAGHSDLGRADTHREKIFG